MVDHDWNSLDDNLLDWRWYSDEGFHEGFRYMRDEDPVHWTKPSNYERGFWSVTRHADSDEVLKRNDLFSSRWDTHVPPSATRRTPEQRYQLGYDVRLALMDDPLHDVYRRPLNKHFTVPAIGRLRERIEQIVGDLLFQARDKGQCDFVDELAGELPLLMVLELLGIPTSDLPYVREAVWQMQTPADPRYRIDDDPARTQAEGRRKMMEYGVDVARRRRERPTEDFASVLTRVQVDGSELSDREASAILVAIITGGLETVRNAASLGMLAFLRNPEQADLVRADPSLAPRAVEEVLRWASPARHRLRIATANIDFHGKSIRSGDWVVPFLASADKDERVFDDPLEFNILRNRNPHLSFGAGIHHCLGRALARLEMSVLFANLFTTFAEILPLNAEPPQWVPDAHLAGLVDLPVSLQAA